MPSLCFDFHGVRARVTSPDPRCLESLDFCFGLFLERSGADRGRQPAQVTLRIDPSRSFDGRAFVRRRAAIHTKDAAVTRRGSRQIYHTPSRATVVYDFRRERGLIVGPDIDFVSEKSYLLVLSRVGALLDRRGLHRIHAMAVARPHGGGGRVVPASPHTGDALPDGIRPGALLGVFPMGGGKTTLALSLLASPGALLLSDECPLVSRDGLLHAFPMRLGVAGAPPAGIPPEHLRTVQRSRYGPKTLIDARRFEDRIAPPSVPRVLLIGRRTDAAAPGIRPLGRFQGLRALFGACVLGRGLPELLEYSAPLSARGLLGAVRARLSRWRACRALLRRCAVYRISLCPDRAANAAAVRALLDAAGQPAAGNAAATGAATEDDPVRARR